jgi:hypothetical protein
VAPVLARRALVPNWTQSAIDLAPSQFSLGLASMQRVIEVFNL